MTNILKSEKLIIVISSPSGAGKSSICKQLLKDDPKLNISISDTTRPPRDNETNGTDYNFIEKNEFEKRIRNNEYIEYANVFGNYYGSLHKDVQNSLDNGFDVLFDIDWQGSLQLKASNQPNLLTIFIIPPSKEIIYERLKLRAEKSGDNEKAIKYRMEMYETEMSHQNEYEYIVENDDFEKCVYKIKEIILEARAKLNI
ncbi:guanylate kinase [Pelagibacterales bacterium SAG-MED32]|nr:guanylate kinase [Pelagibacterales bacterium SAG-MED32]|tara:strand:- start:5661 stop:6260 length:600 start_codon:yes stop_codon:yes gene_type:complete